MASERLYKDPESPSELYPCIPPISFSRSLSELSLPTPSMDVFRRARILKEFKEAEFGRLFDHLPQEMKGEIKNRYFHEYPLVEFKKKKERHEAQLQALYGVSPLMDPEDRLSLIAYSAVEMLDDYVKRGVPVELVVPEKKLYKEVIYKITQEWEIHEDSLWGLWYILDDQEETEGFHVDIRMIEGKVCFGYLRLVRTPLEIDEYISMSSMLSDDDVIFMNMILEEESCKVL